VQPFHAFLFYCFSRQRLVATALSLKWAPSFFPALSKTFNVKKNDKCCLVHEKDYLWRTTPKNAPWQTVVSALRCLLILFWTTSCKLRHIILRSKVRVLRSSWRKCLNTPRTVDPMLVRKKLNKVKKQLVLSQTIAFTLSLMKLLQYTFVTCSDNFQPECL